MTEIAKLFADFNNADQHGRIRLNNNITLEDIKKLKIELKQGMQILLNDNHGLTAISQIKYSHEEKIWVAEIDLDDIKHNDNLVDTLNKSEVQKKFTIYRQLIQNAKSIENDKSFLKQYDGHLNSLGEIEIAFNTNDITLLTKLINEESRAYGWSYLPNDYGEKVETAFWNLKKLFTNNN